MGHIFIIFGCPCSSIFFDFQCTEKDKPWLSYAMSLLMSASILFYSHEINYGDIFATRYLLMYAIILFATYSLAINSKKGIHFLSGFF